MLDFGNIAVRRRGLAHQHPCLQSAFPSGVVTRQAQGEGFLLGRRHIAGGHRASDFVVCAQPGRQFGHRHGFTRTRQVRCCSCKRERQGRLAHLAGRPCGGIETGKQVVRFGLSQQAAIQFCVGFQRQLMLSRRQLEVAHLPPPHRLHLAVHLHGIDGFGQRIEFQAAPGHPIQLQSDPITLAQGGFARCIGRPVLEGQALGTVQREVRRGIRRQYPEALASRCIFALHAHRGDSQRQNFAIRGQGAKGLPARHEQADFDCLAARRRPRHAHQQRRIGDDMREQGTGVTRLHDGQRGVEAAALGGFDQQCVGAERTVRMNKPHLLVAWDTQRDLCARRQTNGVIAEMPLVLRRCPRDPRRRTSHVVPAQGHLELAHQSQLDLIHCGMRHDRHTGTHHRECDTKPGRQLHPGRHSSNCLRAAASPARRSRKGRLNSRWMNPG